MSSRSTRSISERIDEIEVLLRSASDRDYIGEGVSQLDHALQTAALARRASAPPAERVAALLHDIGHRCAPGAIADPVGVLDHHAVGADYLTDAGFDEAVTRLVRHHVDAKRYLVATRSEYGDRLSPASVASLARQGGPMDDVECATFRADPDWAAHLRLRAWDDAAKVPGLEVPPLSAYRRELEAYLERCVGGAASR